MDIYNANNNLNNNKNFIPKAQSSIANNMNMKNSNSKFSTGPADNSSTISPKNKEKLIKISEFRFDVGKNKNETKYSLNNSKDLINRLKNQASSLKSSITTKNQNHNNNNNFNNKSKAINCFSIENKENINAPINRHIQNELSHCHLAKGISILNKHETFDLEKKMVYGDKNKFNKNSHIFNDKNNKSNSNNVDGKHFNNKEIELISKIKNLKTLHPNKNSNNKKSIIIKVNKEKDKEKENANNVNNNIDGNVNNNDNIDINKKTSEIQRDEIDSKKKITINIKNKERNNSKTNKEKQKETIDMEINKEEQKISPGSDVPPNTDKVPQRDKTKFDKKIEKPKEEKEKKENEDMLIIDMDKENEKEKEKMKNKESSSKNKSNTKNKKEKEKSIEIENKEENCKFSPKHIIYEEKKTIVEEPKIYFDISNINDVQIPKDYINIIYYNLLEEENVELKPKPIYTYMKNQKEINDQMRSILVDWIIDVHHKFGFTDETLFMTILIIDRYSSLEQITRIKYQCLGITALMIACKHEEINVPKVEDFIYITDNAYSKEEVFAMENDVLSKLNFSLLYPSPIKFYEYLSLHFNFSKKYHMLGKYLMESFLLDLKYIKYKPSIISCACAYIVMKFFKMPNYRQSYDKKFYLLDENVNTIQNGYGVKDCAQDICVYVDNINNTNLLSCQKKYTKPEFEGVSTLISNNKT